MLLGREQLLLVREAELGVLTLEPADGVKGASSTFVNHPRRLRWAVRGLNVERRRGECENALFNVHDYVLDAQVVLRRHTAADRVQTGIWRVEGRCRRQCRIVNCWKRC